MLSLALLPVSGLVARADGPVAGPNIATHCRLLIPPDPLSAQGLATPWQLLAPCHENNSSQAVFVQGVIFDPATNSISTYSPLVIDAFTTPAIAPTVPTLPAGSTIAIFGGGNDDVTTLLDKGRVCVNGADSEPFGQVFFCGAAHFFDVVNAAHVTIPPLGMGVDGTVCPTVRDFRIVDQDQSDNVQTTYLVQPNGTIAQNTAANRLALPMATVIKNPSDNRVLSIAVDGALGCKPWTVPDLADNGNLVPTQATDELQAAMYQADPEAFIPMGDPMVGPNNPDMVNAYRVNVDQPVLSPGHDGSTAVYCHRIKHFAPPWLASNQTLFSAQPSPVPGIGNNLYEFLMIRLQATYSLLNCTTA